MDRLTEISIKRQRLERWLTGQRLDGALISRRTNFAWITGGGDSHIFWASEAGAVSLLVLPEGMHLIAHTMDGARLMEEEVADLPITLHAHRWTEDRNQLIARLSGRRAIGSDLPTPGLTPITKPWHQVIYPLLDVEVERIRSVGRLADEVLTQAAMRIGPGDSELKLAAMLAGMAVERGLVIDVLLVGGADRPYRYRHCLPKPSPIGKHVLMHLCCQKQGLHANPSRVVHFGEPDAELRRAHEAVSQVSAEVMARLRPGVRHAALLEVMKQAYADAGYAGEWESHFQGGPASYEACEPYLLLDPTAEVMANQSFDFLFSLPGTKIEEMPLLTPGGVELMTLGARWPAVKRIAGGQAWMQPDILVR